MWQAIGVVAGAVDRVHDPDEVFLEAVGLSLFAKEASLGQGFCELRMQRPFGAQVGRSDEIANRFADYPGTIAAAVVALHLLCN